MTTTDTLAEKIRDEVRGIAVEYDYGSIDIGFDAANEVATAVLPIIAEEVRKAKAEARDEGYSRGEWDHCDADLPCDGPTAAESNPYRETGGSDEHR